MRCNVLHDLESLRGPAPSPMHYMAQDSFQNFRDHCRESLGQTSSSNSAGKCSVSDLIPGRVQLQTQMRLPSPYLQVKRHKSIYQNSKVASGQLHRNTYGFIQRLKFALTLWDTVVVLCLPPILRLPPLRSVRGESRGCPVPQSPPNPLYARSPHALSCNEHAVVPSEGVRVAGLRFTGAPNRQALGRRAVAAARRAQRPGLLQSREPLPRTGAAGKGRHPGTF